VKFFIQTDTKFGNSIEIFETLRTHDRDWLLVVFNHGLALIALDIGP